MGVSMLQGCAFCLDAPRAAGSCAAAGDTCDPLNRRLVNGCPGPYLPLIIIGVVLYLAAFSPGLGCVPWSVNAEIFPVEVNMLICLTFSVP
jgi:SP family myo-inositol transporter-like MFS transporter 13